MSQEASTHPPALPRLTEQAAIALLLACGVAYLWRVTQGFTAVPGDIGDARFNSAILEHLYQWVRGDAEALWSPRFFFPAKNALAFSDNHFGSGIVYVLLRFLGMSRELAFDGWYVAGCALNFAAMHWVARRLGFSALSACVAAFIYALPLPAPLSEVHAQLIYRCATPLAWLAFIRWLASRDPMHLAWTAAWGAWQFYCAIYLGVFLGYLLVATALAALLQQWAFGKVPSLPIAMDQGPVRRMRALAIVAASVVVTGALLLKYQMVSRAYGFERDPAEIITMLPYPQSYLLADRVNLYAWIGKLIPTVTMRDEQQMFLGVATLSLAGWALWTARRQSPSRRWLCYNAFGALVLLVLGTLQVNGISAYHLFMKLPGVSSIRAVSRIILIMALPAAVLAAIGIENLLRRRCASFWIPVVVGLLLLENVSHEPFSAPIAQWRERLAALDKINNHQALRADTIIYVSGREGLPFPITELDSMLYAQDHRLATLNGYSGNAPPGYLDPKPCNSPLIHVYHLSQDLLTQQRWPPQSLLAKTLWLAQEPCAEPGLATDTASQPPTVQEAQQLRLWVDTASAQQRQLNLVVHLHNGTASMLHTLSRVDHPLRLSWRFVPMGSTATSDTPAWTTRLGLALSIPPDHEALIPVTVELPRRAGVYDLQFSLVAERFSWLHDLGMPLTHTRVAVHN